MPASESREPPELAEPEVEETARGRDPGAAAEVLPSLHQGTGKWHMLRGTY